ncbi:MAG: methyltransferase domain-containing protein [Candidatus Aenigmarchaeota archaeon]|nr:methyltransferase domain-containing protein [Candidatus Aenigmarchaeota archaeon]
MEKLKKIAEDCFEFDKIEKLRYEKVVSFLKKGKLLDIGCRKAYIQNFCKNEYYGVDFVAESKKYVKNFYCVDISKEKLPFEDNYFDVVFMGFVLEHISNFEFTLNECYRVLKKKGRLIVTVPNPYHKTYGLKPTLFGYENKIKKNQLTEHIHCFSPDELINLLNLYGLKLIYLDIMDNNLFSFKLPEWRIFKLFGITILAVCEK